MEYRGYVFTNHALERLDTRRISKDDIITVLTHPQHTYPTGKDATMKFIKELNGRLVHVVATKIKGENRWLIVSVWVRGENDPIPLVWQVLTLPFRVLWWAFKKFSKKSEQV